MRWKVKSQKIDCDRATERESEHPGNETTMGRKPVCQMAQEGLGEVTAET